MEGLLLDEYIITEKQGGKFKMTEGWTLRDKREYAWEYFKLHAGQRMALFNFFVVISAILTAGLAATLKKECDCQVFGFFLSVGMMLISFVFWKLDQRVAYLIKHAEAALKAIEDSLKEDPNGQQVSLFFSEEIKTKELKESRYWNPCSWYMTYPKCFGVVYLVFALIGLIGCLATILRW